MKNKVLYLFIIILCATRSVAQDVNFSTIGQLPLLLNPSQAGNFDSDNRLSVAFRNVAFSSSYAFSSGVVSLEHRFKKGIDENDRLAIGFSGVFDQSNNGALKSNYAGIAIAYAKALDPQGKSRLSAGLQGVWVSRRLDVNKLVFADQFTSGGFATNLPSADAFRSGAIGYFDVNAGVGYQLKQERFGLDLGVALFHGSSPREQFWGEGYKLPRRYTVHGKSYHNVNADDRIYVQVVANFQDAAKEQLIGAYFSKDLGNEGVKYKLNVGSYYRTESAVVPYLGLESAKWKAAVTYDVNISGLKDARSNMRAMEMNIQYGF